MQRKNLKAGDDRRLYVPVKKMTHLNERHKSNEIFVDHHLYDKLAGIINPRHIKTAYLAPPLDDTFKRSAKRTADIIISLIAIVTILSWLVPLLALLITIDSRGPVFFIQKRNKRGGKLFNCIKFRSMIVNADADILPAGKFDKRITRVGKFLRRHYIDELPQFFNVLLGDMAVVGPRPHMISDNLKYEKHVSYYFYRQQVKPGITGLAQVMGYAGPADSISKMQDRVDMDIFYVRHWSFTLDGIILFRTILKSFSF